MLRNFPNSLRSRARLQSLVGGPRGSALEWNGNRAPWATSSQGDRTGEFPFRFRGRFRTSLAGIRVNTIINIMPKHVLKLKDIRKCPETLEMIPARAPRSSSESEATGLLCYSGGSQGPWIAASKWTLTGSSLKSPGGEVPSAFRGHIFQEHNSANTEKVFETNGLWKTSQNIRNDSARVPPSNR